MSEMEGGPKIQDLDDLEDRLTVFESVVEELRAEHLVLSQLEMFMNQYILLEDAIYQGAEFLNISLRYDEDRSKLEELSEKYSLLTADYQDSWSDQYWSIYEYIRSGYKKDKKEKGKNDIIKEVSELQDLAIEMNKKDVKIGEGKNEKKALKEVDELAKQYDSSTLLQSSACIDEEKKKQSCCHRCCKKCSVF
ncbi:hypothetical protein SteCoe_19293 [Stentor coeruleus]|uniref:Uncharacterized protein n=1 Tax=Stentor coeruleus TaxID=5963 RepID=A0A1R2BUK9_9CILI|nr:hypothetical protein SteCoe_19293 [Stentor coeruleus]